MRKTPQYLSRVTLTPFWSWISKKRERTEVRVGLTMLLRDRGWRSHSQLSGLPGSIAWLQPWQSTGCHIWRLSSVCSFRGIMKSLRYSFVSNDDDSFAIDWSGRKVRLHVKFSSSACPSFFAPDFPPSSHTIGLSSALHKLSVCTASKHKLI